MKNWMRRITAGVTAAVLGGTAMGLSGTTAGAEETGDAPAYTALVYCEDQTLTTYDLESNDNCVTFDIYSSEAWTDIGFAIRSGEGLELIGWNFSLRYEMTVDGVGTEAIYVQLQDDDMTDAGRLGSVTFAVTEGSQTYSFETIDCTEDGEPTAFSNAYTGITGDVQGKKTVLQLEEGGSSTETTVPAETTATTATASTTTEPAQVTEPAEDPDTPLEVRADSIIISQEDLAAGEYQVTLPIYATKEFNMLNFTAFLEEGMLYQGIEGKKGTGIGIPSTTGEILTVPLMVSYMPSPLATYPVGTPFLDLLLQLPEDAQPGDVFRIDLKGVDQYGNAVEYVNMMEGVQGSVADTVCQIYVTDGIHEPVITTEPAATTEPITTTQQEPLPPEETSSETTETTTVIETETETESETEPTSTTTGELILTYAGDVNLDGRVDITDAVLLNKAAAGTVQLSDQAFLNGDVDGTEGISGGDAVTLLRFLVRLIDALLLETGTEN